MNSQVAAYMQYTRPGSCDVAMVNGQMSDHSMPIYDCMSQYDSMQSWRSSGSMSEESDGCDDVSLADIEKVLNDPYPEFDVDEINTKLEMEETGYCSWHYSSSNFPDLVDRSGGFPYTPVSYEQRPEASQAAVDSSPLSPTESTTSKDSFSSSSNNPTPKPKDRKKTKSTKSTLPRFMCQMINSKQHNPTVIKWLNKEEGVFLIVKPKTIAELWGERKGNPKMKYPSMSRGIRERRKYGYFDRVPQDPRYPKKLTYKFGPMVADYLKQS